MPDCGSWLNLNFPSTTSQHLPRIRERPNASIEYSRPLIIMASSSSPNAYSLPLPLQHGASANEPHSKSWRHRLNLLTSQNNSESQNELQQEGTRTSTRSKHVPKWWKIRLFRGMINDVKRRTPFYWSDWTDAWDYRVIPATVYMYFAKSVVPFTIQFVGVVLIDIVYCLLWLFLWICKLKQMGIERGQ
jgi:hypothetical protein